MLAARRVAQGARVQCTHLHRFAPNVLGGRQQLGRTPPAIACTAGATVRGRPGGSGAGSSTAVLGVTNSARQAKMVSPASHDMGVGTRSALAGVAGVGGRHTRQPRRHVRPRPGTARRPVLFRSILYLIAVRGPLSANKQASERDKKEEREAKQNRMVEGLAARSSPFLWIISFVVLL
jgi:hypothetical protein